MPRKLNTWVHVGDTRYGPNDQVPDDVARQITNPDVWAEGEPVETQQDEANLVEETGPPVPPARPPTSGAGSGRDAWAAYATTQGVQVTEDMDRGAIIAAVDAGQQ